VTPTQPTLRPSKIWRHYAHYGIRQKAIFLLLWGHQKVRSDLSKSEEIRERIHGQFLIKRRRGKMDAEMRIFQMKGVVGE
jgi:hypothetical protein